jgi:hypothetical protein
MSINLKNAIMSENVNYSSSESSFDDSDIRNLISENVTNLSENLMSDRDKNPIKKFRLCPDTATCDDYIQWFFERGHNKIKVGGGIMFLKDITHDLETLQLAYEIYNSKMVDSSMFYKRALGLHIPAVKETAFRLFKEKQSSKLYEKQTEYPIDVSGFSPEEFFIHAPVRTISNKIIENETNLDFLNINLKSANPSKIDKLTKIYNQTPIFLLNELHLELTNIDLITPSGYKLYPGKPDIKS